MAPVTDEQQLLLKNVHVSSINTGQQHSNSVALLAKAKQPETDRALTSITEHLLHNLFRSGSPDTPGHDGSVIPNSLQEASAKNSNPTFSSIPRAEQSL